VDVIYIDPPYNTGNRDFVYNDTQIVYEDTFKHSKWLSFMAERIKLVHQLLSTQGMLFISIDDNEFAQLKLLSDSILGEKNYITSLIWQKRKVEEMIHGMWLQSMNIFCSMQRIKKN